MSVFTLPILVKGCSAYSKPTEMTHPCMFWEKLQMAQSQHLHLPYPQLCSKSARKALHSREASAHWDAAFLLFHISASFSLKIQCLKTGGMCCLGPLLASSRSSTAGFSSRSYDPHQRTGNEREADGERRGLAHLCILLNPWAPWLSKPWSWQRKHTTHHKSLIHHTWHIAHLTCSPPAHHLGLSPTR